MLISAGVAKYWQGYFSDFCGAVDSFQYAIRGAVQYGLDNANRYTAIQFSNQGALYQSYMFFLYYSKFDPAAYHALGGTDPADLKKRIILESMRSASCHSKPKKLFPERFIL